MSTDGKTPASREMGTLILKNRIALPNPKRVRATQRVMTICLISHQTTPPKNAAAMRIKCRRKTNSNWKVGLAELGLCAGKANLGASELNALLGLTRHMGGLLRNPSLFAEAIRAGGAMRKRRRIAPSSAYLRWRLLTAYGSINATSTSSDLFHYLRWRMQMRRIRAWDPPR